MSVVPTVTLNDGHRIPQLGFGVWQVSTGDIVASVAQALEIGYRHIDTAAIYGNEEGVGTAIAESGIAREELFITTKLWNDSHGVDAAVRAATDSLVKLGLDYVDLYLIHWPTPARDNYVAAWKGLEKVQTEGLARSIGVSNFTEEHLRRVIAEGSVVPAVNQIEVHPTLTQEDIIAVNGDLGIVTEAYSPLGLSADLDDETVRTVAESVGRSPAQVILRWHLQLGRVVFPKSVTPKRIRENFEVFDFELSEDQVGAISAVNTDNRLGSHPNDFN
ncbi:MAG TPA: aldo/keto reductase [Microlunatus sp.]